MKQEKKISRESSGGNRLAALVDSGTSNSELEKSPAIKALRLLAHLAHSHEPVALSDLCRALRLPKATGYRLAQLLESAGFVQKDPLTLRYSVGRGFETIALGALRNGAGGNTRRLLMDDLSARLGVRTNFTVLKAGKLILVEWIESSSVVRIDLKPGTQVPAYCSASGKLLMAFGPEELRQRFLAGAPFQALTKSTITEARALKRELELIRSRGFSEDNQEFLPGVCCLAVPVRNKMGDVVAGLAVMAPTMSFSLVEARRHLPEIQACADAIAADSVRNATPLDKIRGRRQLDSSETEEARPNSATKRTADGAAPLQRSRPRSAGRHAS